MKPLTYRHTAHACYLGYITQAIINNLAPLLFIVFQEQFQISFSMIGSLIFVNFGSQLVIDALAVKFVDKIGYRPCIVAAHIMSALGLIALGTLPNLLPSPYLGLILSVLIYAVGGGLTEVLISPIVDSLPGEKKASSMSLLHSFYCWGHMLVVVLSTLALKVIGSGFWFLLPIFWAAVPICNTLRFLRVPLMPTVEEEELIGLRSLLSAKVFLIAMLLMICAGAAEQAMGQWSSLFAEKGLQIPKVMGDLLGPCLFALTMGLGRLLYGVFGANLNLNHCLSLCSVLCIGSYLLAALIQNPALSLMGCALCGFSVSLMWPGMLSFTARCYPKGGTAMFGVLAICGDLGCSIGPWVTGLVSDAAQKTGMVAQWADKIGVGLEQAGLKAGLLAAVVFPVILLAGVLVMRRDASQTHT